MAASILHLMHKGPARGFLFFSRVTLQGLGSKVMHAATHSAGFGLVASKSNQARLRFAAASSGQHSDMIAKQTLQLHH